MKTFTTWLLAFLIFGSLGSSCKTKRDVRRDQEYERIKAEVREARGARADLDVISEEFRTELARLGTATEELSQLQRTQTEELRAQIATTNAKVQALEQQLAAAQAAPPPKVQKPASYESAKEAYDAQNFEEAAEDARTVVRTRPKNTAEARKAQYLLAEALFAQRDFGAAALEFSEFKKTFPKDANASMATLRQAQCFRNLGKEKEAKLFYQETVEKYPKSPAAGQAKKELKKAK